MELGQRLKQARLEAGLSQRQLCGQEITRNMLSQIENGAARPSMQTLQYLAGQLGKPVGFFLNEEVASPNQTRLETARAAWQAQDWVAALAQLKSYEPDGVLDAEVMLLQTLCCMELAQAALEQGRKPYALSLLEKAAESGQKTPYFTMDLQRRCHLLLAQAKPETAAKILPQLDDGELLLRGWQALAAKQLTAAAVFLDAAADQQQEKWHILRADVYFAAQDYANAIVHYRQAEEQSLSQLEICYEKLGDYKMAYQYACRQRQAKEVKP